MNEQSIIRRWLESEVGKVWTQDELLAEFELLDCRPQYAIARHRVSSKLGSLWRTRDKQWYHSFAADEP